MKKTSSPVAAKQILRQASASLDEFLGSDPRRLPAILLADDQTVQRRGLTHAHMALRLHTLRRAGWKGLGEPVSVPPHFEVSVDAARGMLPCPFGDQGSCAKVNTTVHNLASGRSITFSDLNIHLIAAHGFYEGRGAKFRLEPEHLMDILEIGKSKRTKKKNTRGGGA